MILSLTIDRAALTLDDLIISNNPFDEDVPFHLPEDGLSEPDFDMRITYAPDSAYSPGRHALAAVLDLATLPLTIYARGTSTTLLQTAKAELAAAVSQWAFDVTVTVDGVGQTFRADPTWPKWGVVDSGMARAFIAKATFTIPVQPA